MIKKLVLLLCFLLIPSISYSIDLFGGKTEKEVRDARGSASTLDVRLDEAMNEDGTLKGTVTMSEWISGYAATYASASSFKVAGDKTAVYAGGRKLYLICDDTNNNAYVTIYSSSYAGTQTTINCSGTVSSDLNTANYSVIAVNSTPYELVYQASTPTTTGNVLLWIDSDDGEFYTSSGDGAFTYPEGSKFKHKLITVMGDLDNAPEGTAVGYSSALAFDASTTEYIRHTFSLDDEEYRSDGGTLAMCVKYSMSSSSATSRAMFTMDWRAVADEESVTAGGQSGTDSVEWLPGNNTSLHVDTTSLTIDSASINQNDMITLLMYRSAGSTTDNHTGDLYIHDLWIEEQ